MNKPFLLSILLTVALSVAVASYTHAPQIRASQSLTGVWKGNFPDAPAVEITLDMQAGRLTGKALFYKVVNSGAGEAIKGKVKATLIDPDFDGQVLAFRVRREDGTFFQGRVRFVAEHEAVLRSDNQATGEELAMTLRRDQ
jgi:hypothetical protein